MSSKPLTATLLTFAVSLAVTNNAFAIADADNLAGKQTHLGKQSFERIQRPPQHKHTLANGKVRG